MNLVPIRIAALAVACLGCLNLARAQITIDVPTLVGFKAPIHEDNRMVALVAGKEAKPSLLAGQVQITEFRLETYRYNPDQQTDLIVESPLGLFGPSGASSDRTLTLRSADGRFAINGQGWAWERSSGLLTIDLWRVLRDEFGPQRKQTKAHPDIAAANAFVGNELRLEILARYARCQQTLDESVGYLLYMADRTGTLWENDGDYASCNHGFASHTVNVLYRDVLGLSEVDTVNRVVRLRFTDVRLDWCEGAVPTADGRVSLNWWKEPAGDGFRYRLSMPEGYRLEVNAPTKPKWERVY